LSAQNRLTAEQLAALSPGDAVTVESGAEFGRRRHVSGRVVRVDGSWVTVSCRGPRGGTFVERYSLRDGLRRGGGNRAELVLPELLDPAGDERRRRLNRVDVLFRAWTRDRDDVAALRRLHAAIGECLDGEPAGVA
jgi:hypothetical protein